MVSFWRSRWLRRTCIAGAALLQIGCITMPVDFEGKFVEAYSTTGLKVGSVQAIVVASFLRGTRQSTSNPVSCLNSGTVAILALDMPCQPDDPKLAVAIASIPAFLQSVLGGEIDVSGIEIVRSSPQVEVRSQSRSLAWRKLPTMRFYIREQSTAAETLAAAVDVVAHEVTHALYVQRNVDLGLDEEELSAAWIGACARLRIAGSWSPTKGGSLRSDDDALDSSLRQAAQVDNALAAADLQRFTTLCRDRIRATSSRLMAAAGPQDELGTD